MLVFAAQARVSIKQIIRVLNRVYKVLYYINNNIHNKQNSIVVKDILYDIHNNRGNKPP